jgi:peroxiredoxin
MVNSQPEGEVMSRMIITYLLILLLAGCSGNNAEREVTPEREVIVIEGELRDGEGSLVTLDQMGVSAFIPIDSTRCDKQGKFSFSYKGDGINYYSLKYTENGYVTLIAKPGDRIRITGSADSIYPYTIEGSEASDQVRELAEAHKKTLDQLHDISVISENIAGEAGFSRKKQLLNEKFDSLALAFNQYSRNFIKRYPHSPATLIALYNQFGPALPVFDPAVDLDIYQFVDSALYSRFPENEAVRSLHNQLAAALQQLGEKQSPILKIGDKAPDLAMETADNEILTLSELRGNFVLLQVWASWSKPSVEENRYLKQSYHQFGQKNFVIVQASIDNDRSRWNAAINTQYSGWYHVSDLNRWESVIISLYGIERIPANFLIDPHGVVIETDIFGDDLVRTLQKYLK